MQLFLIAVRTLSIVEGGGSSTYVGHWTHITGSWILTDILDAPCRPRYVLSEITVSSMESNKLKRPIPKISSSCQVNDQSAKCSLD